MNSIILCVGGYMNIKNLSKKELTELIEKNSGQLDPEIGKEAYIEKEKYYQNRIFARGLIEFTNICKNNCLYCGIRGENKNIHRYRLNKEQILSCCKVGSELGFSTFVLQGGEDLYFTDEKMCDIIYSIKSHYPDCAITLSIGEKTKKTYQAYKNAGADRYLLRHETANEKHYGMLHPHDMSLENRKRCLYDLMEIGFETGAGFMVGSPYQTYENLAEDLLFLKELKPHMVGIGPFLPHHDTPFKDFKNGSFELTITMLALTRLMLGDVLLPATTALATLKPDIGRTKAFLVGANVVMPNLTLSEYRDDYLLYDNKLSSGNEAAQSIKNLEKEIMKSGNILDMSRGNNVRLKNL